MSAYRHVTNLQKPYDELDTNFLSVLGDYREGPPVPPTEAPLFGTSIKTVDELIADDVTGIYSTLEAVSSPALKRLTGWMVPEKILGTELPE